MQKIKSLWGRAQPKAEPKQEKPARRHASSVNSERRIAKAEVTSQEAMRHNLVNSLLRIEHDPGIYRYVGSFYCSDTEYLMLVHAGEVDHPETARKKMRLLSQVTLAK